jgi:hypothetical protein
VRTLPTTMIQALAPFAPLFSKRVWAHVQVLVAGTILAPGKRTVTSALRAVGLEEERQFCSYHRVLNRATWCGITLFAHQHMATSTQTVRQTAWYRKSHPTFSEALALVRKELWAQEEQTLCGSSREADTLKVSRAFVERLTDAVCYAA